VLSKTLKKRFSDHRQANPNTWEEEAKTTTTTTLGDELKDLKDAYDKGIITEKEYNAAKEKIIKQRTATEKK
jgi:hypothetical protein